MTDSHSPSGTESRSARDIRALLFDFDGTLVDTIALILASMRHATHTVLGYTPPDEQLMAGVGVPLATQMAAFSPESAEDLVRVYRAHNWEAHDEMIAEYPGVDELLEELSRRRLPMAVVTSKSKPVTMKGVELFGLERFFKVIVTADDTELHKPDPEPLRYAAELLGVELTESAYLGDSPYDVQAARAGGAVAIAALWGAFPASIVLQHGPDFALRSPGELLELLDGDEEGFRPHRLPFERL